MKLNISEGTKIRSIEPLFESEPLRLIWSANEIEDFRNYINDGRESVRGVLISTLFTIDQIHMAYKCYIIY